MKSKTLTKQELEGLRDRWSAEPRSMLATKLDALAVLVDKRDHLDRELLYHRRAKVEAQARLDAAKSNRDADALAAADAKLGASVAMIGGIVAQRQALDVEIERAWESLMLVISDLNGALTHIAKLERELEQVRRRVEPQIESARDTMLRLTQPMM